MKLRFDLYYTYSSKYFWRALRIIKRANLSASGRERVIAKVYKKYGFKKL
ncbi:hypothetical protein LCGC14_1545550 [marine sediment metagenome]|uniref:Uncharacterized protein n=1 Tax=marine sediment metagenome TaxID=412755 RepID=A0A0F9JCN7_9ZZZZ